MADVHHLEVLNAQSHEHGRVWGDVSPRVRARGVVCFESRVRACVHVHHEAKALGDRLECLFDWYV